MEGMNTLVENLYQLQIHLGSLYFRSIEAERLGSLIRKAQGDSSGDLEVSFETIMELFYGCQGLCNVGQVS